MTIELSRNAAFPRLTRDYEAHICEYMHVGEEGLKQLSVRSYGHNYARVEATFGERNERLENRRGTLGECQ